MSTEYDVQDEGGRFCPECGHQVDPETRFCPGCGASLEEEFNAGQYQPKKSRGVTSGIAAGFFSLFFILFAATLTAVLFFHTVAANVSFSAMGGRMAGFWESVLPVILNGVLAAIPLICIIFLNIRRFRRIFLFLGISAVLTGLMSLLMGLFWPLLLEGMSGGVQDALKASVSAFQDLACMAALSWALLGAVLLSVYSCIKVFRGKKV